MRSLKVSWDLVKIKNKSAGALWVNLQAQWPLKCRAAMLIVNASLAKGGNTFTGLRGSRALDAYQVFAGVACCARRRESRSRDEKEVDLTTSNSLFALPIVQ